MDYLVEFLTEHRTELAGAIVADIGFTIMVLSGVRPVTVCLMVWRACRSIWRAISSLFRRSG